MGKRACADSFAPPLAADIDGFVEASDADYQPVRDAIELMGMKISK